MSSIGTRIKRARARSEWTQDDLARRAGLNSMTLSHYETGRRIPSLNNLIRLADALHVTLDSLARSPLLTPKTDR